MMPPVPRSDEQERRLKNKAMFEEWIAECVSIQEAVIEGLLSHLPSLADKC